MQVDWTSFAMGAAAAVVAEVVVGWAFCAWLNWAWPR